MKLSRIAAPGVLASIILLSLARAQAPSAETPVMLRASIASIDRLKQVAETLGFSPAATPEAMIEAAAPQLGRGWIDTSKPIGIVILSPDKEASDSLSVIALPVKPDRATLQNLEAQGAQAVAGDDGIVRSNEDLAKRTANYLYYYKHGRADLLCGLPDEPFQQEYKGKVKVAQLELNLATARQRGPEQFKMFMDRVMKEYGASSPVSGASPVDVWAGQFVEKLMLGLAKEDSAKVFVGMSDKLLNVQCLITPTRLKQKISFAKPLFPESASILHVVYPVAGWTGWLEAVVKSDPTVGLPAGAENMTASQRDKARDTLMALSRALIGDAQSMCVENRDGMQITLVNQYRQDVDLLGAAKTYFETCQQVMISQGTKPESFTEDWKAGDGAPGLKVNIGNWHALLVQRGRTATIVISEKELDGEPAIEFSKTEKISDALDGHVDLGLAATFLGSLGAIPPKMASALGQQLSGRFATLSVMNDLLGDTMVYASVPVESVKMTLPILLAPQ